MNIKQRKKARRQPYEYLHEFSYALRGEFGRWRKSRRREAERRGVFFRLSADQIEELYARCREHCPCCNLPWTHLRQHPQAPSIDRIDVNEGYYFNNVQILCRKCNKEKGRARTRYMF